MADQPSGTNADEVEYAIDGTEHSRDGYGNLVTVEEQREMLEEDETLERAIKDMTAQSQAGVRAAHPVTFSIPQAVYTAASENPQLLSDAGRALILSRGDVHARALVSPHDLTQADRYRILGWPAPDVVEQRIRAATKPTGTELRTPAEPFAKAERQGTATLTPIERHLLGQGFRVEGSAFEDDDFSDEEQERANKKAKSAASSLFDQFGIPGNREAYAAAVKEEGVNLQIVAAALMQSTNDASRRLAAKLGQPIPPLWQAPGPSTRYPLGQPPGESTGQPAEMAAEEPTEDPDEESDEEQEDESAGEPAGMPAELPFWMPGGAPLELGPGDQPRRPYDFGAPPGAVSHLPAGPGGPFFPPQLGSSSGVRQPGFGLPGQPPFQPPQGLGFGFGAPGAFGAPGVPTTSSGPGVQEGQVASVVPGPAEAAGVLDEVANALLQIHGEHRAKRMDHDDYNARFNNIVASIRGLSDRFTASLPPGPHKITQYLLRSNMTIPPPRRVLGPNPFGLRLSHDGSRVSSADRNSTSDNELPHWGTQVAPWTVWSATIPHRMMEPSQLDIGVDDFITSIQAWTDKEEEAWRDHRAAQAAARDAGQEAEEPPLFFNTPPSWPLTSPLKRPFNVYCESVQDTDAAKAWPAGEIQYAKKKWDAMTEDEQAVYAKLCEDRRRQAWVDSFRSLRPFQ